MLFHDLSRIIDHQQYLATQQCLDEIIRTGNGKLGAGIHASTRGVEGGGKSDDAYRSHWGGAHRLGGTRSSPRDDGYRTGSREDGLGGRVLVIEEKGKEEEDDIYGATPLGSPQHSQDDHDTNPERHPAESNDICGVFAHSHHHSPPRRLRVPPRPTAPRPPPSEPEPTPVAGKTHLQARISRCPAPSPPTPTRRSPPRHPSPSQQKVSPGLQP